MQRKRIATDLLDQINDRILVLTRKLHYKEISASETINELERIRLMGVVKLKEIVEAEGDAIHG